MPTPCNLSRLSRSNAPCSWSTRSSARSRGSQYWALCREFRYLVEDGRGFWSSLHRGAPIFSEWWQIHFLLMNFFEAWALLRLASSGSWDLNWSCRGSQSSAGLWCWSRIAMKCQVNLRGWLLITMAHRCWWTIFQWPCLDQAALHLVPSEQSGVAWPLVLGLSSLIYSGPMNSESCDSLPAIHSRPPNAGVRFLVSLM